MKPFNYQTNSQWCLQGRGRYYRVRIFNMVPSTVVYVPYKVNGRPTVISNHMVPIKVKLDK